MAPVPNTRPNGDDEDPRPIKQPRLGEAEDSNEEKPKLKLDTDPMALDDQSPLVEVEDEPAVRPQAKLSIFFFGLPYLTLCFSISLA
ncbi:hypothetical protein ACFX12_024672 [Malus domestica]